MNVRCCVTIMVLVLLSSGCAATKKMGQYAADMGSSVTCALISPQLCELVSQSTSETVANGRAFDSTYTIDKTVTGRFLLRSPKIDAPIGLSVPVSLSKLQSLRTDRATYDFYAAPTAECPNRYMAVVGTNKKIITNGFGCLDQLRFSADTGRDAVYATESGTAPGEVPWAYRLTSTGITDPKAVTKYSGHPDYQFYRNAGRRQPKVPQKGASQVVAKPAPAPAAPVYRAPVVGTGNNEPYRQPDVARTPQAAKPVAPSQPTAPAVATPVRQARRLPPAEKVTLPGQVEEKPPAYERPSIEL